MNRSVTGTLASAAAVLLTLSCLGPLFQPGGGWVGPAIAAVLLAAACGGLGRALPLSGLTGTLLVLAGGLGLVTAVSAPQQAYLGFIPSGSSFSTLGSLVSGGFDDIRTYSPPVPSRPGLVLLVTAAVFAIAVAVDLFAVGAERPVLAGIPLLALVAVPAAFRPHGLGVLHLLLAIAGWLLLVALDSRDRLVRWGRPLGRRSGPTAPLLLGGAAGRVAGVSVIAAFLIPALIPDLHGGIIHPSSQCCAGGSATVVPPLVTIDNQLHEHGSTPLLRVTTTSAQYLRFTALDYFDGNSFSLVKSNAVPGRVDGRLSSPTPGISDLVSQTPLQATISVLPTLAEEYLPLPYSPVDVQISGNWQLSPTLRTIFSTSETTAGKTFSVNSLVPNPSRAQLQAIPAGYAASATPKSTAASLAADLAVPSSVPSVVFTDEARVTKGQRTAFDKLAALERWFTTPSEGGFKYTLTPSPALPRGPAGISAFLSEKQGFCEQFATVFTLMARHLGLPARVAVGFTPGQTDPATPSTYDVSTSDAHAWPEVWFTGVGWVRFEPTPRPSVAAFTPTYLSAPVATTPTRPVAVPSTAPAPAPLHKPDPDGIKPHAPAAVSATGSGGSSQGILVVLAIALVILLALSPAFGRLAVRGRRARAARVGWAPGAAPADIVAGSHALWSELLDTVRDIGVVLPASETPRAIGRRLAALLVPARFGGSSGDAYAGTPFAVGSVTRRRTSPAVPPRGGPAGTPGRPGRPGPAAAGSGVDVLEETLPADTVDSGPRRTGSTRASDRSEEEQLLEALGRVVTAEELARYGRPGQRLPDAGAGVSGSGDGQGRDGQAGSDLRLLRAALMASAPGVTRLQALLLPRSVLGRARGRANRGGQRAERLTETLGAPARMIGRRFRRN